jgi:hypothetical protein
MMIKGRRMVLFVASLVLCAGAAALLGVTTSTTVAKPGTASSRHAVRGGAPAVDAGVALPGGASEAGASGQVRLVLPHEPLTTAESVPVTVINGSASAIYRSLCFVLERQTSHGWQAIRRSHGVPVICTIWAGVVQPAHSRQPEPLELYEDLQPGIYRITLFYRHAPKHPRLIPKLTRRDRFVRLLITVGPAPRRPRPQLPEKRLLRIAKDAAARSGDPRPRLIQHAAGTRYDAVRIASGDLVFEWNWSYLIAERGHFICQACSVPRGAKPPSGSVLTLVVDAANGQVTDSGISKRYPPLRRLGHVTTDLRR